MSDDHFLPSNRDAEESVLGAILRSPKAIDLVGHYLEPCHFLDWAHQQIYRAMTAICKENGVVDIVSVGEKLGDKLPTLAPKLSELFQAVIHSESIERDAKLLVEHSKRRTLLIFCRDVAADARANRMSTAEGYAESLEDLIDELRDLPGQHPLKGFRELAGEFLDSLSERKRKRGLGTGTGLVTLDLILGGLADASYTVLAARPSHGKTALGAQLALTIAKAEKRPVLYLILEMSALAIIERAISAESGVSGSFIRRGQYTDGELTRIIEAVEELSSVPFYVADLAHSTAGAIRALCRTADRRLGKPALVVVDYLQLIESASERESLRETVTHNSAEMRALAKELNCPLLVLSQLSRANEKEKRPPQLSDLRESGAIEQDADTVLMLHNSDFDGQSKESKSTLYVRKQRNGPLGKVDLVFEKTLTKFREAGTGWENNLHMGDEA